jgi:hypothetical protein
MLMQNVKMSLHLACGINRDAIFSILCMVFNLLFISSNSFLKFHIT